MRDELSYDRPNQGKAAECRRRPISGIETKKPAADFSARA
jgi:hypothetical protein